MSCEHCGSLHAPESADLPEPGSIPEARPSAARFDPGAGHRWMFGLIGLLAAFGIFMGASVLFVGKPGSTGTSSSASASTVPSSAPRPSPRIAPIGPPPPRVLPGLVLISSEGSEIEDLWLALEDPLPGGKRWLERLNGATGRVAWKRAVGDTPAIGDGFRACIDGVLLAAGPEKVFALNPESGETLWTRDTGGPIRDLCSGDGFAGLVFPNDRFTAFSVATGSTVKNRPGACDPVVTSRSVAPNFSVVEGDDIDPPLPARAPFRGAVARVLVPHKGTARVVLTSDRLAAAVAVASRQSWVWSTRLAEGKSGMPRFLFPPLAAVRSERVLVPYILEPQSELRLASLELASGRLVWDRPLASGSVHAHAPDAELRISRSGTSYFADGQGRLWATTFDSHPAWSLGEN